MKVLLRSRSLRGGRTAGARRSAHSFPYGRLGEARTRRAAARLPAVRPHAGRHDRQPGAARPQCGQGQRRRRLDELVDDRRRLLAEGHRQPVRVQLRPADRRQGGQPGVRRVGRRHHRRLLLQRPGRRRARRPRSSRSTTSRTRPMPARGPRRRGCRSSSTTADNFYNPAAARPHSRLAGRRLVRDLGRQPDADRRPSAPARRGGRDARPGLELPDGQRGHRLLHVHVLQRHRERPGRVQPRCARTIRAIMQQLGAQFVRQQRGQFSASALPARATRIDTCSRASAPTWTSPAAGANYCSVNMPVRARLLLRAHVHVRPRRRAVRQPDASGARRSSPARASWA